MGREEFHLTPLKVGTESDKNGNKINTGDRNNSVAIGLHWEFVCTNLVVIDKYARGGEVHEG